MHGSSEHVSNNTVLSEKAKESTRMENTEAMKSAEPHKVGAKE